MSKITSTSTPQSSSVSPSPAQAPPHRSPRRLDAAHPSLASIPLDDKAPPPESSLTWSLWLECQDLAQEALASKYMQGIARGDLDPNRYGQYTVQDAVYCHYAEADYQEVEKRALAAGEPEIAAFAKARHESYASYNQETFKSWHIADPSAMDLSEAARLYVDFEHRTAHGAAPIYGLIAMIPCNQLWAWLASQLKDETSEPKTDATNPDPKNLYSFWIEDNDDWGGAYRLDNFVDAWSAAHPGACDPQVALFTFRSAMTGELNFFRSACGQALEPMP